MSDDGMWETEPEKPWHEPADPKPRISPIRILAVVVFIAIFLIAIGMPIYDPISFAFIVVVFSVFGLISGLCNRGLVRSLRGKR